MDHRAMDMLRRIAQASGAYEVIEGIYQTDEPGGGHIRIGINGENRVAVYGVDHPLPIRQFWPSETLYAVNYVRLARGVDPLVDDATTFTILRSPGSVVAHAVAVDSLTGQPHRTAHVSSSAEPIFAVTVERESFGQPSTDALVLAAQFIEEALRSHGLRRCRHC